MKLKTVALALMVATPASANHPGENLNEVMAAKEPAFEAVDARAVPEFTYHKTDGSVVQPDMLTGKIVAISFVPEDCGAPCADQQDQLDQVLNSLNASPMGEMVEFVTLGDAPESLPAEGNSWTHAQAGPDQTTAELAAAFAAPSTRPAETPMIHLLDRSGRQVGIFHGSEFLPLNLVLYINGLTNLHPHEEPGLFARLFGWLK